MRLFFFFRCIYSRARAQCACRQPEAGAHRARHRGARLHRVACCHITTRSSVFRAIFLCVDRARAGHSTDTWRSVCARCASLSLSLPSCYTQPTCQLTLEYRHAIDTRITSNPVIHRAVARGAHGSGGTRAGITVRTVRA